LLCSTLSNKQINKQANGRYKGHFCVKKWRNTSGRLARVANIEEDHSWFRLSFGFIAPKHLIIAWLSNLSILNVADECYSRSESCALNLISTFLFCLYCYKMKKKNTTPSEQLTIVLNSGLLRLKKHAYFSLFYILSGHMMDDFELWTLYYVGIKVRKGHFKVRRYQLADIQICLNFLHSCSPKWCISKSVITNGGSPISFFYYMCLKKAICARN
jgi:hypothetical protein